MTSRRHDLLANLIRTLIDEWGYEEVRRTLTQIPEETRVLSRHRSLQLPFQNRETKKPKRLSAMEQASKLSAAGSGHEHLLALAMKFDRKEFLPSVADVREFLAMMGEDVGILKDRSEAFRQLLRSLSQLPSDRLERLANSTNHSGPAQLGPLSDAIKSTGDALRRSEQTPDDAQKL